RGDSHPGDHRGGETDAGQEGPRDHAVLVGRLLAPARDAPRSHEPGLVVEAELRVGVAHVHGQEHQASPSVRALARGSPTVTRLASDPSGRRTTSAPSGPRSTATPSTPSTMTRPPSKARSRQAWRTAGNPSSRSAAYRAESCRRTAARTVVRATLTPSVAREAVRPASSGGHSSGPWATFTPMPRITAGASPATPSARTPAILRPSMR